MNKFNNVKDLKCPYCGGKVLEDDTCPDCGRKNANRIDFFTCFKRFLPEIDIDSVPKE